MKNNPVQEKEKLISQEDTYYLALSIKVRKNEKKYLKHHMKEQLKQALSLWAANRSIQDIAIYHHGKTAEKEGDFTLWDYLILIQLKDKENAAQIAADIKKVKLPSMPETVRMELLVTTPKSTYPNPGKKALKRKSKPFYAVEYVDVKEPYLKEFQTIMIQNNGPAMGYIMEEAKWCYNFYALETVSVFYHNKNYPTWNQVHVIGLFLESMLFYKKDFSKGLMLANQISFEDNMARLKQIRTMLLKSVGRKLE